MMMKKRIKNKAKKYIKEINNGLSFSEAQKNILLFIESMKTMAI